MANQWIELDGSPPVKNEMKNNPGHHRDFLFEIFSENKLKYLVGINKYFYICERLTNKIVEIMSLTIEKIVEFAQKNNKRFEAYTPFLDRWNDRVFGRSMVGVELKPHVWFWWEDLGNEDQQHLFFSHRYNQNNGATIKSFRQGWNAEKTILGQ